MVGRRIKKTVLWLQPKLGPWAKRNAARAGQVLGYDHSYPSVPASLRTLASWGYEPRFIVDIGAFIGEWTSLVRARFPDSLVLMVEPQEAKWERLRSLCAADPARTRLSTELLAATSGREVDFFEMETGSSMLAELTPYPRTKIRKSTVRLDDVLAQHRDWGTPDFLKLDVQGAELEVLTGAPATLKGVTFALLETAFKPYNEGAPLVAEVIGFMAGHGFVPIDVCGQVRGPDGTLVQLDLLFMNQDSQFRANWQAL